MRTRAAAPEDAIESYGYSNTYSIVSAEVNRLRPPDRILTRKELSRAVINLDINDGAVVQDNNGKLFTVRNRGSYISLLPS